MSSTSVLGDSVQKVKFQTQCLHYCHEGCFDRPEFFVNIHIKDCYRVVGIDVENLLFFSTECFQRRYVWDDDEANENEGNDATNDEKDVSFLVLFSLQLDDAAG